MITSTPSTDAAFARLYRANADRVMAYCLRQVGHNDAEDVVSEAFLIAWRRRQVLPEPPLPWLLVTARNPIADSRRRYARSVSGDAQAARLLALAAPDAVGDAVTRRQTLIRALGTLSTDDREALLMIAWDGLTAAQAAQVMGCSTATFNVRLHRARKRLEAAADETAVRGA